jgi:hypothetical protein
MKFAHVWSTTWEAGKAVPRFWKFLFQALFLDNFLFLK